MTNKSISNARCKAKKILGKKLKRKQYKRREITGPVVGMQPVYLPPVKNKYMIEG